MGCETRNIGRGSAGWVGRLPNALSVLLAAVLLLVGTPLPGAAQQTGGIGGRVLDESGGAVAGARVELVGGPATGRPATTDAGGRYRIEGLAPGGHVIRVAASDFLAVTRRVNVAGTAPVTVDVTLQALRLPGVVVTAAVARAALEAERDLTPGAVTVIGGEDLARRPVNNLADALRYVPGVWAESSAGADEFFFSSRGSNLDAVDYDDNGIKLLQDGMPVTTADGNNHNRAIDPLSVRYAVVARGPNALTYGASTLGGAIDFVSPTARNSSPFSLLANSGGYGPFNGRASAGTAGARLDGLVTVEGRDWDGYRDHSGQRRWGIYGNAGWLLSDEVELRLFGTHVDSELDLPGALTRDEVGADPGQASGQALGGDYGKDLATTRLAGRMRWTPSANSSLMAGMYYETQDLYHPIVDKVLVDFDGPGPQEPVEVFSLIVNTDHRDAGGVLRYNHRIGGHDLVAGANYGRGAVDGGNYRNDGGRLNGITQHIDNRSENLEAYVMDRWRASERWTVVLGGQYVNTDRDVRTTDAASGATNNPRRRYTSFNPRAGVIASFTPALEAYANVSRTFEAPTTFQMEDNVRGGDATLDPMSGVVGEVGVRSTPAPSAERAWNWEVTLYYGQIRDEILSVDDPQAPGNSLTTNVDRTIHAGVEAMGGLSLPIGARHRIDPLVSLTINRFNFDGDPVYGDNRLPAAPTFAARGELLYRHAGGAYVGPTFDVIGERYADFANTYVVDGHELVGLRAGLSTPRWELFGEVRNLFDTDYTATVGVLNVAAADSRVLYPGAPRSLYVGARYSY